MLVDLARNDLGRVCVPGSVEVVEFMAVERYSHVMHLVSTVEGDLAPGRVAFDVLQATFPAGTLSGAPKPRAMEIIDKLEPTRRGRLRRGRRLLRRRRRPRHGDRDPHGAAARRHRVRAGGRRDRRGLRPGARGRGVPQQGRGGAAGRSPTASTLRSP